MPTTTDVYGWPKPVNTDRVADGWDAISDAVEAIETTVAALPLGEIGYAERTSNLTGITALQDLTGLSVAVVVGTSRRIRITAHVNLSATVANDSAAVVIREGSTTLREAATVLPVASRPQTVTCQVIVTPSSGAHTYKLSAQRDAGSGTVSVEAAATRPAFILVEDLGPA